MTGPLPDPVRSSHGARLNSLRHRAIIAQGLDNGQFIRVVHFVAIHVHHIGDSAPYDLFENKRAFFMGETENVQGFLNILSAHKIHHLSHLPGRTPHISSFCYCFHLHILTIKRLDLPQRLEVLKKNIKFKTSCLRVFVEIKMIITSIKPNADHW